MSSSTPKAQTPEEQIAELREIIDKLTASMVTVQGNQGQLTVAVNRMQSDKLLATGTTDGSSSGDAIAHAAHHGHKLLFPTYDSHEDPPPALAEQMRPILPHSVHGGGRQGISHDLLYDG
jgi:hypothetical protein